MKTKIRFCTWADNLTEHEAETLENRSKNKEAKTLVNTLAETLGDWKA